MVQHRLLVILVAIILVAKASAISLQQAGTYAVPITIGAIALVTVIVIVAVVLFIKKNKKPESSSPKKSDKVVKMEDGMVEIELDSQPGTQHATPRR
uniref:Uncharacterized protein n=1 Tax=Caenorhabditis tropicalis TaxID=1561998 RepID=A0A1I7UKJ3_9PELO